MSKKILIVEDDQFLNKMYVLHFADAGDEFEVETVTDGAKALAAIETHKPDIMLLDLLMPKMDGFAVLEEIKKKGYTFPIIVLTNLSQKVDKDRCRELGAKDFFVKSDVELEDLTKMIKKYL